MIGTWRSAAGPGRSFADVRGKTIAVDPSFRIDSNVIKDKPALHIFQQTSDDFFDSGFLKAARAKLSFSFLDGMHLFEYLLRDFINTEKNSHPDSVIVRCMIAAHFPWK